MKAFRITEVLIYNPQLKSKLKKPIESDIQEAKIISYYPREVPVQQKCNTVGMAQGVYQFCKSFHFTDEKTKQNKQQQLLQTIQMKISNIGQVITMDTCSLALKEVQQNIWLFLKLQYVEPLVQFTRHTHSDLNEYQQDEKYMQHEFTQEKSLTILQHFYDSFFIFYGRVNRFVKLDKFQELNNIIEYFIPKYHVINTMQPISTPIKNNYIPKLSLTNYLFANIRAIPLDVNTTLKFQYFKNVLMSYDPMVSQLIIFANGFLTYSSTCKQLTEFFARYFYGLGQPFKFDFKKYQSRFQLYEVLKQSDRKILYLKKYGSVFNSISYGFEEKEQKRANTGQEDLLGINEQLDTKVFLLEIYLPVPPYTKYYANYYSQKNMTYITLYKEKCIQNQIIFQNRFFHDNTDRFLGKISEILTGVLMQNDNYIFIYSNSCTGVGKSTLQIKGKDLSGPMGSYLKYAFAVLQGQAEGGTHRLVKHDGMGSVIATTYKDCWVYGIKRMNRMLLILIPSEVPLHKLGDFVAKMSKQYFSKGYM